MTANIPDLIVKLEERLAALGDGHDLRTDNERADWWTTTTSIRRTISGLKNAPQDLAKPTALLAEIEERRAAVIAKQEEIEKAIAEAPALPTAARDRDREAGRQSDLQKQLQLLHEGRLFLSPGVPAERLGDLDVRIAEMTVRRNRAQAALDAYVQQAQIWLDVPVTVGGLDAR
jgi:hypothetical protein